VYIHTRELAGIRVSLVAQWIHTLLLEMFLSAVLSIAGVEITTRQMRVEFRIGELFFELIRQLGKCFFPPLSESFFPASAHCTNAQQTHDFGEFFSDLASKNFELLASLASALKILIPLLHCEFVFIVQHFCSIEAFLFIFKCVFM
jgi:hypothetical protein